MQCAVCCVCGVLVTVSDVILFQYYIELNSHYETPRPPAAADAVYDRPRAMSLPVDRQQSTESGVFMSRTSSDTSPQRATTSRHCSDDVWTHLSPAADSRCQSTTDAGYLLPTTPPVTCRLSTSQRHSVASDSDLCGSTESDNVFELDTLLPV